MKAFCELARYTHVECGEATKKTANRIRRRVDIKLLELSNGPYPRGFKKLHRGGFRLRVGDYRVLYDVDQVIQTIAVSEIIHRSEAYR